MRVTFKNLMSGEQEVRVGEHLFGVISANGYFYTNGATVGGFVQLSASDFDGIMSRVRLAEMKKAGAV
jgi:hypothetical protein